MTTNWLLIFLLVITTVVSLFVPQILGVGEFGIGDDVLPEEPSVWDVLVFNAGWIWDCMTFEIPDIHWIMGIVFWVVSRSISNVGRP